MSDITSAPADQVALDKIYGEVRAAIRETDNISFRLLGLVPLVSGTALIGFVLQSQNPHPALLTLVALFAAGITLGLFRWELRNVQTCVWLLKYAEAVEREAFASKGLEGIFRPQPRAPQKVGKAEALKFIYAVTIVAWLALPLAMGAVEAQPEKSALLYYVVASGLVLSTATSIFANPHVPPVPQLAQSNRNHTSK